MHFLQIDIENRGKVNINHLSLHWQRKENIKFDLRNIKKVIILFLNHFWRCPVHFNTSHLLLVCAGHSVCWDRGSVRKRSSETTDILESEWLSAMLLHMLAYFVYF